MFSFIFIFIAFCNAFIVEKSTFEKYPKNWQIRGRANPERLMHLSFAIKNRNLDQLEEALNAVSFPNSPDYGKHWSKDQVDELTCPSKESLNAVHTFISKNFNSPKFEKHLACGYINVIVKAKDAEIAFSTELHEFVHNDATHPLVRTKSQYSLPDALQAHVVFVGGLVNLPTLRENVRFSPNFEQNNEKRQAVRGVTPKVYQARFSIGSKPLTAQPGLSVAFTQFIGQFYDKRDLLQYEQSFARGTYGVVPNVTFGPQAGPPGIEANLDVQTIIGVSKGAPTTVYSDQSLSKFGQEPFLNWAQIVLAQQTIPNVISISYGDVEASLSLSYVQQVDAEFMKIGLRGSTVLASAGDSGASCTKSGSSFEPDFPTSATHLTSIGGTDVARGQSYLTAQEIVWRDGGGGFSNFFQRANNSVTNAAVDGWLAKQSSSFKQFIQNPQGNAYPVLSAFAESVWIVHQGNRMQVGGTSCSSPATAAALTILNNERLAQGKATLGWFVPALFTYGGQLTRDVVGGECNVGCAANNGNGYCTEAGFDVATGWGVFSVSKALQVLP